MEKNEMCPRYSLTCTSNLISAGVQGVWTLGYSNGVASSVYMLLVAELDIFF